jgi:hypothetical protein
MSGFFASLDHMVVPWSLESGVWFLFVLALLFGLDYIHGYGFVIQIHNFAVSYKSHTL